MHIEYDMLYNNDVVKQCSTTSNRYSYIQL